MCVKITEEKAASIGCSLMLNMSSINSATSRHDGDGDLKAHKWLIGFLVFRGNWI